MLSMASFEPDLETKSLLYASDDEGIKTPNVTSHKRKISLIFQFLLLLLASLLSFGLGRFSTREHAPIDSIESYCQCSSIMPGKAA